MITLTDKQNNAIKLAKDWWFNEKSLKPFVILGMAGSGKSTIVKFLVEEIGLPKNAVSFCTLTGKAASVLQRKGNPATTIHRLIYDPVEDPKTKEIKFELKEKLPEELQLIVVDEFAMVNKEIMNDLMSFGKKLILIGDPYQLPPPFGEKNGLDKDYDVLLDEPMRQALESPIIYLANQAKNKQRIKYGEYGNCKVIRNTQIKLSELKEADQVIAGKNVTVKKLNRFYRNKVLDINSLYPKKGEKLMCLKNNYSLFCTEDKIDANLVNGLSVILESDIDEMQSIASSLVDIRPEFFEDHCFKRIYLDLLFFKYEYNKFDELFNNKKIHENILKARANFTFEQSIQINPFTFGYVCTCYKYQGSEAPNIFFFQEFMGKETYAQHLYTGITRASEKLTLVL